MTARIDTVEGIGPTYRAKLHTAGIETVDTLLSRCGTPEDRRSVASMTGLREAQIAKWVRTADMMRVRGVGKEYSQLLEAAGVASVEALKNKDPAMLCGRLAEVNEARRLARRSPALHEVSAWIGAAQNMEVRVH